MQHHIPLSRLKLKNIFKKNILEFLLFLEKIILEKFVKKDFFEKKFFLKNYFLKIKWGLLAHEKQVKLIHNSQHEPLTQAEDVRRRPLCRPLWWRIVTFKRKNPFGSHPRRGTRGDGINAFTHLNCLSKLEQWLRRVDGNEKST